MDASAPSARCVWPRITPGGSVNVRLTRCSNSRTRSMWVKIQICRSAVGGCALIGSPLTLATGTAVPCGGSGAGLSMMIGNPDDQLQSVIAARAAKLERAADVRSTYEETGFDGQRSAAGGVQVAPGADRAPIGRWFVSGPAPVPGR